MLSLNANLTMASQALAADTGALTVTNNNIANANTPGYARQIVDLSQVALAGNGAEQDGGVSFNGFTAVRDQLLQLNIDQKTSDSASLNTQSTAWSQIESTFSDTSSGIGAAISQLFSSLSGLSTAPQNSASRQTAYSAANQLVDAFHQAAASLNSAASDANSSISGIVNQINQTSTQIADLNGQLAATPSGSASDGGVQSQIDNLTTQLAELTGLSSTQTGGTSTLSTSNGSLLVAGTVAYSLHVTQAPDGTVHVLDAQGQDITSEISGGSLGGSISMRDSSVPQLSSSLDQLASQFTSAMNAAQQSGYDLNGAAGTAMFSVPSTGVGAAAAMSLDLQGGSGIAISSDGSPGSSGNLANLLSVQTQSLPSGQNPTDAYAGFVQSIGSSSASASSDLTATNTALTQLQSQQSSESGVSIDEETTNLLRYQQAYQAAAQVINTMNSLFSVVLNMSTVTN